MKTKYFQELFSIWFWKFFDPNFALRLRLIFYQLYLVAKSVKISTNQFSVSEFSKISLWNELHWFQPWIETLKWRLFIKFLEEVSMFWASYWQCLPGRWILSGKEYSEKEYSEKEIQNLNVNHRILVQISLSEKGERGNPYNLKGSFTIFFFFRSGLIFWIVMRCGIADFGRRGLKMT